MESISIMLLGLRAGSHYERINVEPAIVLVAKRLKRNQQPRDETALITIQISCLSSWNLLLFPYQLIAAMGEEASKKKRSPPRAVKSCRLALVWSHL